MTPVPWGVVADSERGLIYVLDEFQQRVLVFDSTGSFDRQVGQVGGGPEEYRCPLLWRLRGDGTTSVLDNRLSRIARWKPGGEWIGVEEFPVDYWGHGRADLGDRVLLARTSPTEDPIDLKAAQVKK